MKPVIVMTCRVTDSSILTVDDHLTPLVLSNFTGTADSLALCPVNGGVAAVALTNDRPAADSFDYMLINSHKFDFCLLLRRQSAAESSFLSSS